MNLGGPAAFDDPLRRLPRLIKLPVTARIPVGRIEDGLFEELVVHDFPHVPVHQVPISHFREFGIDAVPSQ